MSSTPGVFAEPYMCYQWYCGVSFFRGGPLDSAVQDPLPCIAAPKIKPIVQFPTLTTTQFIMEYFL